MHQSFHLDQSLISEIPTIAWIWKTAVIGSVEVSQRLLLHGKLTRRFNIKSQLLVKLTMVRKFLTFLFISQFTIYTIILNYMERQIV